MPNIPRVHSWRRRARHKVHFKTITDGLLGVLCGVDLGIVWAAWSTDHPPLVSCLHCRAALVGLGRALEAFGRSLRRSATISNHGETP